MHGEARLAPQTVLVTAAELEDTALVGGGEVGVGVNRVGGSDAKGGCKSALPCSLFVAQPPCLLASAGASSSIEPSEVCVMLVLRCFARVVRVGASLPCLRAQLLNVFASGGRTFLTHALHTYAPQCVHDTWVVLSHQAHASGFLRLSRSMLPFVHGPWLGLRS